jgi:hypothetical protein
MRGCRAGTWEECTVREIDGNTDVAGPLVGAVRRIKSTREVGRLVLAGRSSYHQPIMGMDGRWLWIAGVAVVLLAGAAAHMLSRPGADPGLDRPAPFPEVDELRAAVDQCTEALQMEQARFKAHERGVDSLRAMVLAYESDERTVPVGEFDGYLEAFTAYNEAVRDWHDRASALQAQWAECHELAERHNVLVDSLRGGAGVEPVLSTGSGDSGHG